jgi:hypothetical protein
VDLWNQWVAGGVWLQNIDFKEFACKFFVLNILRGVGGLFAVEKAMGTEIGGRGGGRSGGVAGFAGDRGAAGFGAGAAGALFMAREGGLGLRDLDFDLLHGRSFLLCWDFAD